jgi:DNA-binding NarL/FixJ family response regulator
MQTSVSYRFLIVGDSSDEYSSETLREALTTLGSVHILSEDEMIHHLKERSYNVVIVDAGAVADAAVAVSQIRSLRPNIRVVVITASPHWKVARAVLAAGATDYLRKSWNTLDILASFSKALE